MIQYTLYCKPGIMFHSKKHFLLLGDWLQWAPDLVILKHGLLSDSEAHQIRNQEYVNIYQSEVAGCMDIFNGYNNRYFNRKENKDELRGYAGYLVREYPGFWTGDIHVK